MNKCYCIYCQAENDVKNKKCRVCDRPLKPVDEMFSDFVDDKAKDKIKGKIISTTKDLIIHFIKTHVYGIVMSITIVASITGNIIVSNSIPKDRIVKERPSILNKVSYDSVDKALENFLIDATLGRDITKYKYATYYEYGNIGSEDYYNVFVNDYNKAKSMYGDIQIKYNYQLYNNEILHSSYDEISKNYSDRQLSDEIYDMQIQLYRDIIGDISLKDKFEDVRNVYISFAKCMTENCENEDPFVDDLEFTTLYHNFMFVKRDGNWYYLKDAKDSIATMPDDKHLGYAYNGKFYEYSWEM